jgi:mRNA degradation ribonuclease J1/J2
VRVSLFHAYDGRRIITNCFASHVHRVQQIADAAIAFDRAVATMGMSMKKYVKLAREMVLLKIPDHRLRDIEDIGDLDPGKVCVISTGSQGEPMSALALMAASEDAFQHDATTIEDLQRHVRRAAGRYVNQQTRRRPMIVPVVMEA